MEAWFISDYSEVPENTVLKLRAVAPSENQRFDSWSDNVSSADRKNPEITVTLRLMRHTPRILWINLK